VTRRLPGQGPVLVEALFLFAFIFALPALFGGL